MEKSLEIKLKDHICEEKVKYIEKIESTKHCEQVPSTMTVKLEETIRNNKNQQVFTKLPPTPTDATIQNAPFYTDNFIISKYHYLILLLPFFIQRHYNFHICKLHIIYLLHL